MGVKPGYTQADVGIIPEDWEVARVGEVTTKVGSGITPRGGSEVYKEEGRPFLRSQNVGWGRLLLEDIAFIDNRTHAAFRSTEIELGDVLLNITGASIGRIAVADERVTGGNVNQHVCIVRAKRDRVLPLFLKSFLLSSAGQKQIDSFQAGGNRQGLNFGQIRSMQVPVPSLNEQSAIAEVLNEVDALIAALSRLIAKKQAIKQGAMQQLLTGSTRLPGFSEPWEVKTVGEAFRLLRTASNSRGDLSPDGEVKYIHYGDVHTKWRCYLDCEKDDIPRIHERHLPKVPFLEDGDLVMVDASEDYEGIGASVEVKDATGRRVVAGLHTLLLRGDKDLLANGFNAYIQYIPSFKEDLIEIATGTSVYGVSKSRIRQVPIPLPPLPEQRAIAEVLSDLDAEIAALEARRDKTRALKQGMMQELLTGRIRLV